MSEIAGCRDIIYGGWRKYWHISEKWAMRCEGVIKMRFGGVFVMRNYDRYQNYTESKYNKKGISWLLMKKQADKKLIPYVKSIQKKKILEVGPGYGYYTRYLLENQNEVSGVDINPELGSDIGIEITKGQADQLQDIVHDKYDRICSFFMTEYLDEQQMKEFMLQSIALLKPSGIFATTAILNRGLGRIYITLARMKGVRKFCYSIKALREMLGEERKVRIVPLNTVFHIPFAVLIEVEQQGQK